MILTPADGALRDRPRLQDPLQAWRPLRRCTPSRAPRSRPRRCSRRCDAASPETQACRVRSRARSRLAAAQCSPAGLKQPHEADERGNQHRAEDSPTELDPRDDGADGGGYQRNRQGDERPSVSGLAEGDDGSKGVIAVRNHDPKPYVTSASDGGRRRASAN